MTSRGTASASSTSRFPSKTESATAGRFELAKDRRGNALGRFVYGKSYLARADAVAIDPVELKLSESTYETTRLNGMFGALRDAGPDYWGRRLIEKHAGVAQLGELDYLPEFGGRPRGRTWLRPEPETAGHPGANSIKPSNS